MNAPSNIRPPHAVKVVKIGNTQGVILPKELMVRLGLEPGDLLDVVEQPDGFEFRRHDAGFAEQMEAARAVMKARRAALRELAK